MRRFLLPALSALFVFFLSSCDREKENGRYTVNNLSGTYTLSYVGPDSRGFDLNQKGFCGGIYHVYKEKESSRGVEYGIYSGDSAFLFRTRFHSVVNSSAAKDGDTIFCYTLVDAATYDSGIHTPADSLLIADPSVRRRVLFAHREHLLIQTDTGKADSTLRYFKITR